MSDFTTDAPPQRQTDSLGLPDSLAELERIRERAIRSDTLAAKLGIRILPRPGSVFAYRGTHLYFATEARTVLQLTPTVAATLTALLLGDTMAEALDRVGAAGERVTESDLTATVVGFRDAGLLRVPPASEPLRDDFETHIALLMAHQPMKMMLFMAQTCNLRCAYCYGIEGNYKDEGSLMSEDTARAAVDYLFTTSPRRSHYYIYFFGGEPLLNISVMRATVAHARQRALDAKKTVEFGVTTNGTLLTEAACKFLVDEDFQIVVSLDGTPRGHDANRPTKSGTGSSKHVLKGLQRLRGMCKRSNQLKIRATMSHQNHDPVEISTYFESLGIRNFGIGSTIRRAENPQPTDLQKEDFDELERSFDTMLSDILTRLGENRPLPKYNPFFRGVQSLARSASTASIGCGVCRNDQGIGTDGEIYPCHRYVGIRSYSLGNVHIGLDRGRVLAFYKQFFDMWAGHCSNCWARYACSGSCAWQHSADDGVLRNPDPVQCNSIRRSLQRTAWFSTYLARHHPRRFTQLSDSAAEFAPGQSEGCCHPA